MNKKINVTSDWVNNYCNGKELQQIYLDKYVGDGISISEEDMFEMYDIDPDEVFDFDSGWVKEDVELILDGKQIFELQEFCLTTAGAIATWCRDKYDDDWQTYWGEGSVIAFSEGHKNTELIKELIDKFENGEEAVEVFISGEDIDDVLMVVANSIEKTLVYDDDEFTVMTVERFKDYYQDYIIDQYLGDDQWENGAPMSLLDYAKEYYRLYI